MNLTTIIKTAMSTRQTAVARRREEDGKTVQVCNGKKVVDVQSEIVGVYRSHIHI